MNLNEMRQRVREDLMDTDPAQQLWSDNDIENMVQRVVDEYSLRAPIESQDDVLTTASSREIDISSLTDLIKVVSVEYPVDQTPPYYQRFNYWAGHLSMTDEGDGVQNARVRWTKRHEVTTTSTTIPEEHAEIIILGTTGYLAMSISAYTVDRATMSGDRATINYRDWGKERLQQYKAELKRIAWANRVRTRELYVEE